MTEQQTTRAGERAKGYKKTLNLPKTPFPMKANLVQNEPAAMKRWDGAGLYDRAQAARRGTGLPRFVFHDGPPYANAAIHLGHMLNKSLKDFVVRSRLMEGRETPYVPGWDCHGLPIEHRVMADLAESGKLEKMKALDDDARRMAIRRACKSHAEKQIKLQAGQMRRLLTLADYDDPYLTMTPEYEAAVLEVFADLVARGVVYRQLKAVHWSIDNETALADAELEYDDREDISVYVDFEAADADAVYDAFGLDADQRPDQTPTFMIWTTTPWTLPANLAIAVNAKFTYALVRVDGNVTVLAGELVERVTNAADADSVDVLATAGGERLVGLRYRHPFMGDGPDFSSQPDAAMRNAEPAGIYRVVGAPYVTLDDGTGLVHTAPGHGAEDYLTGLRERLPVYCPVRGNGTYDASVAEHLRGLHVWKANERITEDLRASGHLFYDHRFVHSYPHDWRGKSPVIFRATEQWFIGVDTPFEIPGEGAPPASLRDRALGIAEDAGDAPAARFIPEWGRNRMRGMLESRPDWCISRQRAWGLPIPAFYTPDGDVLLTPGSVRAVARAVREEGSDSWFLKDAAHLLRHYDHAEDADLTPELRAALDATPRERLDKGHDIFDVWFESGSSWHAVMRQRSDGADYPVDLYLEGSDQHRGWFQLSMLSALGVTGRCPFKTVLTHGFMVDRDGKKMSKSLGNTLTVQELLDEFGADVCRWWLASTPFEHDMKSDLAFFKTAGEAYRKIRNTLRFMLSNLDDFTPSVAGGDGGMCVAPADIPPASIDAWVLGALDRLGADVRAAYDSYEFARAAHRLYNFANDTLSATYLAAVKDRLYCDPPDSPRRRRTQTALWDLTDALARLLAPVLPHTADEAFRALRRADAKAAEPCVHLERFPGETGVDPDPRWPEVNSMLDRAARALETFRARDDTPDNPLDLGVRVPANEQLLAGFDLADLADLLGVSRFAPDASLAGDDVAIDDLRGEPRCERSWKRDGTVKERSDGGLLSDRDAQAVGAT